MMPSKPLSRLALAVLLACSPNLGLTQEAPLIHGYRLDLSATEIADARLRYTRAIAAQSYLLGLPAFMNLAQLAAYRASRVAAAPDEEPFGGWFLVRNLSTPATTTVMPNVDTLYGAAFLRLDLQGPVVLSIPAISGRYASVALLDAYFSSVEVFGPRTTGGLARNILIAPPGWAAATPEGIDRVVVMPTPVATLFQRIYLRGEADLPMARALQDQIRLAPIDKWRADDRRFPRVTTAAVDPAALFGLRDPLRFFEYIADYTALNPPPEAFRGLAAMANQLGLGPGGRLPNDPAQREAIAIGARDAQAAINAVASAGPFRQGWRLPAPSVGRLGFDPLGHAAIQVTQVGSLPTEEAMYFVAVRDGQERPLDGRRRNTMTFPAGGLPPIASGGFWSLTMYRAADGRLVENSIGRYAIRPDTPGLTTASDGSLTLFFSTTRPDDVPEGNWLPAPAEEFLLTLRAYLPEVTLRNGNWFPPPIHSVP